MSKDASSFEITLNDRPENASLTRWLYEEVRRAILDGRLSPGTRLPATRDFASQYGISRGTAVSIFEQLQSDGYLKSRVGAGSWVNESFPRHVLTKKRPAARLGSVPVAMVGLEFSLPAQPFRLLAPIEEFPVKVWARLASRRLRSLTPSLLVGGNIGGSMPLREAIAAYLGSSRGVNCSPEQIAIVSGVQQGLDVIARLLLKPGDAIWMEDPGYFGATMVMRGAGAKLIPVPVDEHGLSVATGNILCRQAKGAYVTPAHQFPLGMAMSFERRLELLAWARETGAFVIEDDYDSEYRFEGNPLRALQGLDTSGSVIFLGSFNKILFPSLRIGYVVLPPALIEPFMALRYETDLHSAGIDQMILCDFITEGHLGRHLRRTRAIYSSRLAALLEGGQKYLGGLLDISKVQAGLYTAGLLCNKMSSREAETRALANGVESMGLDRFTLKRVDVRGLLLGFAGFDEKRIRSGLERLARALEHS